MELHAHSLFSQLENLHVVSKFCSFKQCCGNYPHVRPRYVVTLKSTN